MRPQGTDAGSARNGLLRIGSSLVVSQGIPKPDCGPQQSRVFAYKMGVFCTRSIFKGFGMGRARGVTGGRMGVVERSHRKGVGMGRLWGRRAVEGRAMGRRSRGAVLWGIKGSKRECTVVAASSRERRWLEWVQGEGQQAPPHCSPRGCCWWGWWRSIGLRSLVGRATLRWLPWSLQGFGG